MDVEEKNCRRWQVRNIFRELKRIKRKNGFSSCFQLIPVNDTAHCMRCRGCSFVSETRQRVTYRTGITGRQ